MLRFSQLKLYPLVNLFFVEVEGLEPSIQLCLKFNFAILDGIRGYSTPRDSIVPHFPNVRATTNFMTLFPIFAENTAIISEISMIKY